ncbi:chaperone NapD [Colwellia psychrerythraea]|uniref:Chaperone NapD n=1 Tax=Colwellia psychrerythraea TaxID=28229 RepID=A0A099KIC9_COLPS|nr:chaperone NapD [Colwellia psychrerythraea]KGJ90564.1 NapD family protein [Colwellia psychrerythraea]
MTKNTEDTTSEYHVASFVAYPLLAQLDEVKQAITDVEGSEIHATSEEGKIVFTIEGNSYRDIGTKMDIIRVHKGIINLSPVYHQILDESTGDDVAPL